MTTDALSVSGEMAPAPLVVCATRGGQGSRAGQTAAIEFAQERNARLIFLYVVDVSHFEDTDVAMQSALRDELLWIGQSLLHLAKDRARLLGVSAEIAVLEGELLPQLIAYAREHQPISLVLGTRRGTVRGIFGDDQIEQMVMQIEHETGIDVLLVRPDTVEVAV